MAGRKDPPGASREGQGLQGVLEERVIEEGGRPRKWKGDSGGGGNLGRGSLRASS